MRLKLVKGGRECLLQAMNGGDPPVFSSIKYGNGPDAGDRATEMSNVLLTIPITEISRSEGSEFVRLKGYFSNADIVERFRVTETGVFIQNPSDHSREILFAYSHVESEEAILIPSVEDYTFETTDSVLVYVGETQNITAIISESMAYTTKAEFNAHADNLNNPHHVNKEQIGLGNVPNVTTDSQTPLISEIEDPITEQNVSELELYNGDTLTRIVTKISYAIRWFISHTLNKNNPHGVTINQIGAASETHQHTASQITGGVLSVARGGTGVSSLDKLTALVLGGVTEIAKKGTYQGNSLFGATNKTTIEYDRKPKILIVQPASSSSARYGGFVCLADVTTIYCGGILNDVDDSRSELTFSWGDKSVSWYSTKGAGEQLNEYKTYRYILIF